MNRLALAAVSLLAITSAAQGWQKRADDFRVKVTDERKKLGLDKKAQVFPTPEVKFLGQALEDGTLGVICPGEALTVSLDGVPPKSLVTANIDDVEISKESWAGSKWTGTLTAKKTAAPRTFSLVAVYATSGREAWSSAYLVGCKRTLTLTVDGATLTLPLDVRGHRQSVAGEWKKGGKVLGPRTYEVSLSESGVRLSASLDAADMERMQKAMQVGMTSPKMVALNKRFEEAMKKIEACAKKPPAAMGPCMQAVQPETDKIGAEREALNAELELSYAPLYGCNTLDVETAQPENSDAENCAGHHTSERQKVTARWN